MGKLYDDCVRIQRHIEANHMDMFTTRGALALKCGFLITLVKPDEPDDPVRMQALQSAAKEVLGLDLR